MNTSVEAWPQVLAKQARLSRKAVVPLGCAVTLKADPGLDPRSHETPGT